MSYIKLNFNKEITQRKSVKEEVVLTFLANQFAQTEKIDSLMGRQSYEGKIKMFEHQTSTALHVLNNFSHRALLADEVGLGKTIEAGMIIKELKVRKLSKKILILTPATLKYQWQEELRSKFDENFIVADNPDDYENELVIASIDTAKTEKHKKVLENIYWDLIVIDEAHKLKNNQTQNYKLVKALQKERCFMLTATPLQNNLFELWALVNLLHPGFLKTKAKFTEEFLADKDGLKLKNKDELQKRLATIMVRNLRKNTNIKFSKRNVKTHMISFTLEEQKFYEEVIGFVKDEYQKLAKEEKKLTTSEDEMSKEELESAAKTYRQKGLLTFSLIMLTRQLASSIKTGLGAIIRYAQTVEDEKKKTYLESIIAKGKLMGSDSKIDNLMKIVKLETRKKKTEKIIIFTSFLHTQKIINMELNVNGYSTVMFNGKMTPEEKEVAIDEFKADKQVLVCTDSGSEGRNLQFAHILINYDLPWNPMRVEQRIGRVHRIGQEKDVIIHNLAIKDTIEGYILNRLYEKIDLFQMAIGDMDMILSNLKGKESIDSQMFKIAIGEEELENKSDNFVSAKESMDKIKEFDSEIFD